MKSPTIEQQILNATKFAADKDCPCKVCKPTKSAEHERTAREMICKSCGVKWTDHNGIQPTCAALQVALKALEQISVMPRNRQARHLAIGARSFIETQLLQQ